MMITIPRDVRRITPWAGARHVEIEYNAPYLIIRPLLLAEIMRRPRSDEEDLALDEATHPQP